MKYHIKLLSDTLPGSGLEASVVIDSDVSVDEQGMPVIPGKRVKGLLLESAHEFQESFAEGDQEKWLRSIEKLFGLPGKGVATTIHVSDAHLSGAENLSQWLAYFAEMDVQRRGEGYSNEQYGWLYQPGFVTDYFTYTRYQTALEEGVAKRHSLRSMRVLKRGLSFTGRIEVRGDKLTEDDNILLQAAAKNLRFMGQNRNRGFGHIAFNLEDEGVLA